MTCTQGLSHAGWERPSSWLLPVQCPISRGARDAQQHEYAHCHRYDSAYHSHNGVTSLCATMVWVAHAGLAVRSAQLLLSYLTATRACALDGSTHSRCDSLRSTLSIRVLMEYTANMLLHDWRCSSMWWMFTWCTGTADVFQRSWEWVQD